MIVTTTVSVGFEIPEEAEKAMKFETEHEPSEWRRIELSGLVTYTWTQSMHINGEEKESCGD